jgi:coenzyme PQQ precursor peptide PqqA
MCFAPRSRVTYNLPERRLVKPQCGGCTMSWTTPTLVEICLGLEINGYLPAEF